MLDTFRFHHIGIATDSIEKTAKYYLDAGYRMTEKIYDPVQNVNIVFLSRESMPTIELLEPGSPDSPVSKTLEKTGVSPYQMFYCVENIEITLKELKKKRFLPLSRPVEAVALGNKKICFLFNKEVGLIELVEE